MCQTQAHKVPIVQQTLSVDSQSSHPPPMPTQLQHTRLHTGPAHTPGAQVATAGCPWVPCLPCLCPNYSLRGWHIVSPNKRGERRLPNNPLTSSLHFYQVTPQSAFPCLQEQKRMNLFFLGNIFVLLAKIYLMELIIFYLWLLI